MSSKECLISPEECNRIWDDLIQHDGFYAAQFGKKVAHVVMEHVFEIADSCDSMVDFRAKLRLAQGSSL